MNFDDLPEILKKHLRPPCYIDGCKKPTVYCKIPGIYYFCEEHGKEQRKFNFTSEGKK